MTWPCFHQRCQDCIHLFVERWMIIHGVHQRLTTYTIGPFHRQNSWLPCSWDVRMIWPKSSQLGPKSSHGWDDFQPPGPPGGVPGGLPPSRTRPGAQTLHFPRFRASSGPPKRRFVGAQETLLRSPREAKSSHLGYFQPSIGMFSS